MAIFPIEVPPLIVPGLQAWYDFTSPTYLTLSSTAITQALDRSGNGNNTAVQGTGTARPTFTGSQLPNGGSAAVFDGGDYLTCDGLSALMNGTDKPLSVFISSSTTISPLIQQYIVLFGKNSTIQPLYGLDYDGAAQKFGVNKRDDAVVFKTVTGGDIVSNVFNIFSSVCNGTTVDLFKNNVQTVSAGDVDVGVTTLDNFTIGASNRNGALTIFLTGVISHILIYNRALTAAEIARINRYLSNQTGVAIS